MVNNSNKKNAVDINMYEGTNKSVNNNKKSDNTNINKSNHSEIDQKKTAEEEEKKRQEAERQKELERQRQIEIQTEMEIRSIDSALRQSKDGFDEVRSRLSLVANILSEDILLDNTVFRLEEIENIKSRIR